MRAPLVGADLLPLLGSGFAQGAIGGPDPGDGALFLAPRLTGLAIHGVDDLLGARSDQYVGERVATDAEPASAAVVNLQLVDS